MSMSTPSLSGEAARLWRQALALNRAAADVSPSAGRLPPLIFFTDPVRTPRPWTVATRLPPGAAVIYRGFGRPEAADEARRLRAATRAAGVRLLIGQDTILAAAVEADGVHLPERDLDHADAARAAGMALVTGAAHGPDVLASGSRALDALILSPVFASASPSAGAPLGVEAVRAWTADAAVPVYALGGVTADTAPILTGSGVCGLCGIEGIVAAFG